MSCVGVIGVISMRLGINRRRRSIEPGVTIAAL
jgi:hypothetical protein